jgi:hypothetical protein
MRIRGMASDRGWESAADGRASARVEYVMGPP